MARELTTSIAFRFDNQKACEAAADQLYKTYGNYSGGIYNLEDISSNCIPAA